ncbi:MAG: AhpC/TSA family protein [Rikenellaceae bacterium]|nr:AhpC/TSA family protein [Rikenellaceae bacterium]
MKRIALLALAALVFASCADRKYSVTIELPVGVIEDGQVFQLINYDNDEVIDSVVAVNNRLCFEGKVVKPYAVAMKSPMGGYLPFVLEPGAILIDSMGGISGTPGNDALIAMKTAMNAVRSDATLTREEKTLRMTNVLDSTFEANKENAVGYFLFLDIMEQKSKTELDSLLNELPAMYSNSVIVTNRVNFLTQQELTVEGQPFVDFTLRADDGSEQKLSDYVGRGEYVLVDFWASWCGPCRREMPTVKDIFIKYKNQGLKVLGVAVNDEMSDAQKAIEDMGIEWPVIFDVQGTTLNIYGISGIPHLILFAPDGTIVSRGARGDGLKAVVDAAMSGQ